MRRRSKQRCAIHTSFRVFGGFHPPEARVRESGGAPILFLCLSQGAGASEWQTQGFCRFRSGQCRLNLRRSRRPEWLFAESALEFYIPAFRSVPEDLERYSIQKSSVVRVSLVS